jgi:carbon monoxide dehydrogenase subunit G
MRYERTQHIAAPPDVVWGVMTDIASWPSWTKSCSSAERLDSGPLRAGSEARLRLAGAPTTTWRVTSMDEGRSFVWESNARGVRTVASHAVMPSAGGGTDVRLAVEYSGVMATVFRWMLARVSERNLAWEAEGLARESERRAGAGA